jgi:hypothetical protein
MPRAAVDAASAACAALAVLLLADSGMAARLLTCIGAALSFSSICRVATAFLALLRQYQHRARASDNSTRVSDCASVGRLGLRSLCTEKGVCAHATRSYLQKYFRPNLSSVAIGPTRQ